MRQYLHNLLTALRGVNPFELELKRIREDYNRVAEQVTQLQSVYGAVKERTAGAIRQVSSLQRLVENLRERITEKDTLIERMKADYQERIKAYTTKIDELQNRAN